MMSHASFMMNWSVMHWCQEVETLMVFASDWIALETPIYELKKSKAYIVIDGRGRIDWQQTEGLIVVTREDVAPAYIKQLKKKKIRYIQAGRGEYVDLPLARSLLYDMGFRKLGLSGGGSINGAFLR